MIAKLVFSCLKRDKIRFAVAVFGIAAATGMLTWALGMTMSAVNQTAVQANRLTAPYSCWLTTTGIGEQTGGRMRPGGRGTPRAIPDKLVEKVRSIPAVEKICRLKIQNFSLDYRPGGKILQGPGLHAALALAPTDGCPFADTVEGAWPGENSPALEVAVSEHLFAYGQDTRLPTLGTPLVFITSKGNVTATVTAIIRGGKKLMGFPTAYGSRGLLDALNGGKFDARPSLLLCRMRSERETGDVFEAVDDYDRAAAKAGQPPAGVQVFTRKMLEPTLASDSLKNLKSQTPLLLTLSLLTALCMLVNSLNISIEQKTRTLALLRAGGMTARQLLGFVAFEGMFTAFCGWAAGFLGGWFVTALYTRTLPDAFPEGAVIGWLTPAATFVLVMGTALAALIWPCIRATRIRPLDAMADKRESGKKISAERTLLGGLLLLPLLALGFGLPLPLKWQMILLFCVGLPLHALGIFLFLPFLITAFEKAFGPAVSRLTGIDRRLNRQRLSRNFGRTAGMVLTLGVGLGTFVAIHVWGGTLMGAFIPSRTLPEIIVSVLPHGLPRADAQKILGVEGVDRGLEMEAAQFYFTPDIRRKASQLSARRFAPDYNMLLIGADPERLLGGDSPLAQFKFVAGDAAAAIREMTAGRGCVITAMFWRESGLGVGDAVEFLAGEIRPAASGRGPGRPGARAVELPADATTVKIPIVGVVDVNWHMVTSRARLRGRGGMPSGTSGPVFVSEDFARRLTGNRDRTYFVWLNLNAAYREMGELPAGLQLDKNIRAAIPVDSANSLRVHHRDEIADGTIAHGAQIIGDMARAPFWSLIVLSTGIIALLLASYQASAREIAVMRAVGMTRSQLARLLLGEAVLTGGCGVLLSLLCGLIIGWTFTGITRASMPWGGLQIDPQVPFGVIAEGVVFAMALVLLMSAPVIAWLTRRQDADKGLAMR